MDFYEPSLREGREDLGQALPALPGSISIYNQMAIRLTSCLD